MAFNEKYVTVTGGGLHDGSSEANAWTLNEAYSNHAAGDRINMKAVTYTLSSTLSSWAATTNTTPISIRGYKTTIGDLDSKPTSQLVDGTDRPLIVAVSSLFFYINQSYFVIENIAFESQTNRPAAYLTGNSTYSRCKFIADSAGSYNNYPCVFQISTYPVFLDCLFDGNGAYKTQQFTSVFFTGCVFSELSEITTPNFFIATSCIFKDLTNGIVFSDYGWCNFTGNTFYNITNNAITVGSSNLPRFGTPVVRNNIFHTIGGDAITNFSTSENQVFSDNNLFYNVTGSNFANDGFGMSRNELVDTSDPFTDAAGGDYSLVSGSNGYNAAQPSLFEGLSIGSNRDCGAIQHQDPAGGGGNVIVIEE